jgi:hypothetical protein
MLERGAGRCIFICWPGGSSGGLQAFLAFLRLGAPHLLI